MWVMVLVTYFLKIFEEKNSGHKNIIKIVLTVLAASDLYGLKNYFRKREKNDWVLHLSLNISSNINILKIEKRNMQHNLNSNSLSNTSLQIMTLPKVCEIRLSNNSLVTFNYFYFLVKKT